MSGQWSMRFSDELLVTLSPDGIDWLDGTIREGLNYVQQGEFSVPLDPKDILDRSASIVWGGLMLPDTLPVLDNGCGDVLCLRFGRDGGLSEVIRWAHEGNYWQPFGNTLAEAILCDIASSRARGTLADSEETGEVERALERWAVDWTTRSTGPRLKWIDPCEGDRLSVFRCLLDAGICEVVARSEFCRASLTSGLEQKSMETGGEQIARDLSVDWAKMAEWLFDTASVPDEYREQLSRILQMPIEEIKHQDWAQATREAQRVRELRPDLAWPYAVMGWAAEREQDFLCAIADYTAGLRTLGSSLSCMSNVERGFVAARLSHLLGGTSGDSTTDAYLEAALTPTTGATFPSPIRQFWMREAQRAESSGDYRRAYECYYAAGWDDHVFNDMDQVLDGLVRSADRAGYAALSRIARHHLNCMAETQKGPAKATTQMPRRSRLGSLLAWLFGR